MSPLRRGSNYCFHFQFNRSSHCVVGMKWEINCCLKQTLDCAATAQLPMYKLSYLLFLYPGAKCLTGVIIKGHTKETGSTYV